MVREKSAPQWLKQYGEKLRRHLFLYRKKVSFSFRRPYAETLPVFIMGYGRSGTTMLLNTFERDMRIEVLGENDPKIATRDYLLVYEKIVPAILSCKAEVLVAKPILNSFDALKVLDTHPRARVVWMLRDYHDVVASAVTKFGSVVADYMREFILHGTGDNWLAQGLPVETAIQLRSLKVDRLTDYDLTALVWWAVNRSLVIDNLCLRDRVMLVRYEELVQNGESTLGRIYEFIGLPYNHQREMFMHTASVGKGADIRFDADVEQRCNNLIEEIKSVCS